MTAKSVRESLSFEGVCENSRHPKTPARGLGGSVLRLLTPFPGNPGNPLNPLMSSRNGLFVVNNSTWGHACSRML